MKSKVKLCGPGFAKVFEVDITPKVAEPNVAKNAQVEPSDCYCVCHSSTSSRAYCDHCKGDNDVARYHKQVSEPSDSLDEIWGLEASPSGEPHYLLTRNEKGEVQEGVDFIDEVRET